MSRSGKTAIRGMTESEIKLLSSLPGIETSVVELVTTLSSLVSQSADRETRLLNKIDLLTKQVNALSEDVVSLKEAAIVSASVSPQAQCQRTSKTSRRRSARKAGRAATGTNDPSNCMSTTTAHRSVCDSVSDTDDTENSDQEATHPAAGKGSKLQQAKRNDGRSKAILDVIADDSWQLVSAEPPRPKKAMLYVGNLSESCTEESLAAFVKQRSAKAGAETTVHDCSMHRAENGKVSARLMVEASALLLVVSPNFWPRPLYARPWQFKDRDQHQNAASQDNLGSSNGKHSTTDPTSDKE